MDALALRVRGLTKRYGSHQVLTGCDLDLPTGSVTGLLGLNGAGKTTLLRCLLGLARPNAGSAELFATDAWDAPEAVRARIGYVPQDTALFGWMRVTDLVAYVAAFHAGWDHALARSLLERWAIPLDRRSGVLSPGEAQRLALVLALAHRPDLLVLDEPAAALDPVARRQFLAAVIEVAGHGTSVLISTHFCADLERIADRVAILRGGAIAVQAGVDELKERVRRLRIATPQPLPRSLGIAGIRSRSDRDGGTVLVVEDGHEDIVRLLEARFGVTVSVDALALEDIAVELLS